MIKFLRSLHCKRLQKGPFWIDSFPYTWLSQLPIRLKLCLFFSYPMYILKFYLLLQVDLSNDCSNNEESQCGEEVTCVHRCQEVSLNATVQHCRSLALLLFGFACKPIPLSSSGSASTLTFLTTGLIWKMGEALRRKVLAVSPLRSTWSSGPSSTSSWTLPTTSQWVPFSSSFF